jgi:hypothetical protein
MAGLNVPRVAHRFVAVEGVRVCYREAGPPDAPTMLLLHGFPSASHQFRRLIELSPEAIARSPGLMLLAVGVHTAGMLLLTTAVAVLVYEKFGLAWLRRAWLNVDVLWTIALFMAGVLTLVW